MDQPSTLIWLQDGRLEPSPRPTAPPHPWHGEAVGSGSGRGVSERQAGRDRDRNLDQGQVERNLDWTDLRFLGQSEGGGEEKGGERAMHHRTRDPLHEISVHLWAVAVPVAAGLVAGAVVGGLIWRARLAWTLGIPPVVAVAADAAQQRFAPRSGAA